jgi:hypothetical protein
MKILKRIKKEELYHFVDGIKVIGKNKKMHGDCSGLSGDCTDLNGNCSGLSGDLDLITEDKKCIFLFAGNKWINMCKQSK